MGLENGHDAPAEACLGVESQSVSVWPIERQSPSFTVPLELPYGISQA